MSAAGYETRISLLVAGLGFGGVLVALFLLPHTPGLDELELHTAVYAHQHYGRLFYPAYDLPYMYLAPPTKYWLVSTLGTLGVHLRVATAVLFLASYFVVIVAAFACRFSFFDRLAALWAISTAVTLYPFISYHPENLTHGERIGRLRPDDLVLMLWLGGLFFLEASRRRAWRASYAFAGAVCIGLASVTHWYGLSALGVVGVYMGVALVGGASHRARPLLAMAFGVAMPVLLCVVVLKPYLREVWWWIFNLGGDPAPRALADVWQRHATDYWFLMQWMERHAGNVWAAAGLLAGPVSTGVPPLVFSGIILLARRSTRVLGLAGLVLPLAVLRSWRKSSGYELPEVALFLLACAWALAVLLERITNPRRRLVAAGVFAVPLLTASPLLWDPSTLHLMDQRHAPELLRAMGRTITGPGASVVGPFYVSGGDNYVQNASPLEPGIDFVVEREFHLASAPLHRLYQAGQARIAGFVLAPEAPSASTVYFADRRKPAAALTGFLVRSGTVKRFSSSGTGWRFKTLLCRAISAELPWVSPRTSIPISGYVPRTDHCVNSYLLTNSRDDRFATAFLRRTMSTSMGRTVLVPLLIDAAADSEHAARLGQRCECQVLETLHGGLAEFPAHWLLAGLRGSDRTIRFFANSADLASGRSMDIRFAAGGSRN